MQTKSVGLVLIIMGVIWLLNNLGFTQISLGKLITVYWPVIFVIWGVEVLVSGARSKVKGGNVINGLLLLVFGAALLGSNLGYFKLNFSLVWKVILPLVIILVGWNLLKGSIKSSDGTHYAFMNGIELKKEGWKLESGNFLAFMGGIDMDMTTAYIPDQEVYLNLTAIMGGIDIRVPRDFTIECHGTAILGGVDFLGEESGGIFASKNYEQQGSTQPGKKLIIRCSALMGGISVMY
ncbi:MAG: LiaF domain-containing protein [Bacillota bacterium]|jgi:predicted membrane protein